MAKPKFILFLILYFIIIIASFIYTPAKFYTDGGSCYQGITATIHHLFLITSGLLSIGSLLAKTTTNSFNWFSKTLSVISFSIWAFWVILFLMNESSSVLIYLIPYLIFNFILLVANFRKQSN